MSDWNRRKGPRYEVELVDYFREQGHQAERLRLTGIKDEGDVVLTIKGRPYLIEAKNRQQMNLAGWIDEASIEAMNFGTAREIHTPNFGVVHKRRGKSIGHSYVTIPLWEWLDQLTPEPF